jgi:hypothetical protein
MTLAAFRTELAAQENFASFAGALGLWSQENQNAI